MSIITKSGDRLKQIQTGKVTLLFTAYVTKGMWHGLLRHHKCRQSVNNCSSEAIAKPEFRLRDS